MEENLTRPVPDTGRLDLKTTMYLREYSQNQRTMQN